MKKKHLSSLAVCACSVLFACAGVQAAPKVVVVPLGAGEATNPSAFISAFTHQVKTSDPGGNLCIKGSYVQYYSTVIDHSQLNGNPDAILFVTPNYGLASSGHMGPATEPYGVYYDNIDQCGFGAGKWVIYNYASPTALNNGQLFNVMMVLP